MPRRVAYTRPYIDRSNFQRSPKCPGTTPRAPRERLMLDAVGRCLLIPQAHSVRWMLLLGQLLKMDCLSDRHLSRANDRAVNARVVLIRTDDRLQNLRIGTCRVRVEVDDRAASVVRRDAYAWPIVRLAEHEHATWPFILLERHRSQQVNYDVRAEPPHVSTSSSRFCNRPYSLRGDHGNVCLVEDAVPQVHHLDGSAMTTLDLGSQFLAENRQLIAFRCPDVRRHFSIDPVFMSERREEKQIRQLARSQPRKAASLLRASDCKPSITFDPVPPQLGGFKSFTGHGFDRVPEDCLYSSDLGGHGFFPLVGETVRCARPAPGKVGPASCPPRLAAPVARPHPAPFHSAPATEDPGETPCARSSDARSHPPFSSPRFS